MNLLDKIHQLLASDELRNAQLALALMKSQGIDLNPYEVLVGFYRQYFRAEGDFEQDLMSLFEMEKLWIKLTSIEVLPEEIALLPKLNRICCCHNKLKSLPNSIGEISQLEILDLYCNRIEKLPVGIVQLQKLKRLDLYDNQLKELPENIDDLVNLEDLNIASNPIKKLPKSIWNLRKLKVFKLHATPIPVSVQRELRMKLPKNCKVIF